MVKVTFTVDSKTVDTLKRVATRLNKPQSAVFREAIRDYADRADRLSSEERERMLGVVDHMMKRKPSRPEAEVDTEIAEIRKLRRRGGRGHRAE